MYRSVESGTVTTDICGSSIWTLYCVPPVTPGVLENLWTPRLRFVCFTNISLRHVSFCCVRLLALFEREDAILHHVAVGFFPLQKLKFRYRQASLKFLDTSQFLIKSVTNNWTLARGSFTMLFGVCLRRKSRNMYLSDTCFDGEPCWAKRAFFFCPNVFRLRGTGFEMRKQKEWANRPSVCAARLLTR